MGSMTNEIVPFVFEGTSIRVLNIEGNPWWVASEITRVLGITNTSKAVTDRVDEEDRGSITISDGTTEAGGSPKRVIINESGLYSLVLGSRLPSAKRFKRWITSEVLPEIRKWGFYDPSLSEDEKELKWIERYRQATIERIEAKRQLAIAAPKAARHELLQQVDGGYNVASVGRAMGYHGQLKVFWQHLVDVGAVEEDKKGRLVASEQWVDLEYMVIRGQRTPVITEEGLQYLESLDLS